MTDQVVTYERDGEIGLIGLNRPEKRNAMNEELKEQLTAAVRRTNEEARVGIIFGHGPDFCAGLDLNTMRERLTRDERQLSQLDGPGDGSASDLVSRGDIPFVVALHGAVIGGGFELAASAHIRVADETAYFALPEGQRGIYVGAGGSARISRLISVARMTDMMLTGRSLSAAEAMDWNAVQYVVGEGRALGKARELAAVIAQNSRQSNFAIVNGLPRLADMSYHDALFFEGLVVASTFSSGADERMREFLEGRARPVARPRSDGIDQSDGSSAGAR